MSTQVLPKNIQLSEKVEFLMLVGNLELSLLRNGDTYFSYRPIKVSLFNKEHGLHQTGVRLIDFINLILEVNPLLYQYIQQYMNDSLTFKLKYGL